MAAENIGVLVPTKIPGYVDAADIQAALRLYHYGSYSYDINETDPAELVNPSIAYTLNNLQTQITAASTSGIQASIFAAKGDLISASANDTPLILSAGSNNQFLIVNSATATGLQWTNALTGPTVSGLYISDSSIVFEGSSADEFETTLTVTNPTADRTITLPNVSGTVITTGDTSTVTNAMLAGSIANNKLANSTISGVALGSNLNALTIGTGLSGTSYNGSGAVTIAIDSTVVTLSGTQTLTNKTLTSPTINNPTFTGQASGLEIAFGQSIVFEGTTADDFELTLSAGNPTADRTITMPDATGTVALTANNLGVFASTTSAQLAGVISDETGSGSLVFGSSPTISTPTLTLRTGSPLTNQGDVTLSATGGFITLNNGSVTQTYVSTDGTQTLTNKTLTAPAINLSTNAITTTTYIPVLADNGKLVTLNNAGAITLTVPTNTSVSYATGAQINILQLGAGQVTVVGDTGVTVYATPGAKLRAQYSAATLIKLDTNTWLLTGDLSA